MKRNFAKSLAAMLKHEGGYVNDSRDPGGPTNKGVTLGTLKRLGIDVNGDNQTNIVDLKALRPQDFERVYRTFFWDAVQGDLLPDGVDYAVFDFAVNSGPTRAIQHMQRALGVTADGHIGPQTMAAVNIAEPTMLVRKINESRLRFMRGLAIWKTYGNGWTRRVNDVTALAESMIAPPEPVPDPVAPARGEPTPPAKGFWATLITALAGIWRGK